MTTPRIGRSRRGRRRLQVQAPARRSLADLRQASKQRRLKRSLLVSAQSSTKQIGAHTALPALLAADNPISPEELLELSSTVDKDAIRVQLGQAPNADIDFIMRNPYALRYFAQTRATLDRAAQLRDDTELKAKLALPVAEPKRSASVFFREPLFEGGVSGYFRRGKESITSPLEGLDRALEPLDVFSQSVAEAARGKDITAFNEGPAFAVEKFRERPILEQVALGVIDPFIVFGLAKAGVNALRHLPLTAARQTARATEKAARVATRDAAFEKTAALVVTSSEDLLERIDPRTTRSGPFGLLGRLRRAGDPSSEIPLLEAGSAERLGLESQFIYVNAKAEGRGFKDVILSKVLTRGSPNELFEIPTKIGDEARASSITHLANGNRVLKVPFFGDVFQDPNNYQITTKQREWIDNVHEVLQNTLEYAKLEGVDVKELGALDDAFHYFPRRVVDVKGKRVFELVHAKTGEFARVGKHRYHTLMEEAKLAKNKRYAGPFEALDMYFTSIYDEIARVRQLKHLEPLINVKQAPKKILRAADKAKKLVGRMATNMDNVTRMARGFVPSGATRAAMKRQFPALARTIDEVMRLRPTEIDALVNDVSRDTLRVAGVTKERFGQVLREVQEEAFDIDILASTEARAETQTGRISRRRGQGRADFTDASAIHETVRRLSIEGAVGTRLIREAVQATERVYDDLRKSSIAALRDRMTDYHNIARAGRLTAERAASRAKAFARNPDSTQARVPSLPPSYIFDEADAAVLRKTLQDNGNAVWKHTSKFSSVVRTMRTAIDAAEPFIQGLPVLMSNPKAWAKGVELKYRAYLDPQVRARYVAENAEDIVELLKHGGHLGSTEFSESLRSGGWLAALPVTIGESGLPSPVRVPLTGVTKTVNVVAERFTNSFELFLDVSRIEMWKGLRTSAKGGNELNALAVFVNQLTGVVSSEAIGVPLSQRQFEGAIVSFAPRYMRAQAALALDTMRGGLRGELARKALGRLWAGLVAFHVAAAQALDQPVNIDPSRPADFLTVEIAGQRWGPGSKQVAFMKAGAKVVRASFEDPGRLLNWEVWDAEDYRQNPMLQFLRNQSSVITGGALNLITGADPIGRNIPNLYDPVNFVRYTGRETSPFWADAAVEAHRTGGVVGSAAATVGEFFGGVNTFPIPTYSRLVDSFERYSQEDYGISFNKLRQTRDFNGRAEVRAMLAQHDDLRALQDTYESEQRTRKSAAERVVIRDKINQYKTDWITDIDKAGKIYNAWGDGPQTPQAFKKRWSEAAKVKRRQIEELRTDHKDYFEELEDYFGNLAEESSSVAAMQEFFDRISTLESEGGPISDETGEVNHFEIQRIRDQVDEIYGQGMMDRVDDEVRKGNSVVRDINGDELELHERGQEYTLTFSTLRPYWNVYRTIVPEERWREWEDFVQADERAKELLRRSSVDPPLAEWEEAIGKERDRLATEDQAIDEALVYFHGRTPLNKGTIKDVLDALKRSGFPG